MQLFEAIWKSVLLGTVQGLTEFLPVSSSGHLILLQRLLGYSAESVTFVSLMLHVGTLLAVAVAFRREILSLFRPPFRRAFYLLAATIPAGVTGLLFASRLDALFTGEWGFLLLAVTFLGTAALLLSARRRKVRKFGWRQTAAMGLMQAAAILPGLSRSGSTIAAGMLAGADPKEASEFSFLMSIPVIAGGFLLGCLGIFSGETVFPHTMPEIVGAILGILTSAVSGGFAIRVMKKLMSSANYKWFALYLVILSFVCLILHAAV